MIEGLIEQVSSSQEYFERSSRKLAEADSDFAPAEGMFTAAAMVAHVAQTIDWFVEGAFAPQGFAMDFEAMDSKSRDCKSLEEARTELSAAFGRALEALKTRPEAEWMAALPPGPIMGGAPRCAIIGAICDHTAHHRGALSVYTRLRGQVPPMPYMEM